MRNRVPPRGDPPLNDMRRSYVRVMVVWVLVLAGLYGLQSWFS
nr:hypothetical protein WG33_0230 [uncultured bacterium]